MHAQNPSQLPATRLPQTVRRLMLVGALIGALAILSVFVDTLQQSVRRGDALREAQRSAYAPQRAAKLNVDSGTPGSRNFTVSSQ